MGLGHPITNEIWEAQRSTLLTQAGQSQIHLLYEFDRNHTRFQDAYCYDLRQAAVELQRVDNLNSEELRDATVRRCSGAGADYGLQLWKCVSISHT